MMLAQGVQQSQAASNIDVIAIILSNDPSGQADDAKNTQSKDKMKDKMKKHDTNEPTSDTVLPKSVIVRPANMSTTKDTSKWTSERSL